MTDTSKEAVERHLNLDHNHEAGLIPAASQAMIRALLAERDDLQAKLAEAKDTALAMVAAENEACAQACEGLSHIQKDHHIPSYHKGHYAACLGLAGVIRARTDEDAKAALEQVKREAKNEALREAAELVRCSDFKHDAHDAILALCYHSHDLIKEGDS